MQNFSIIIFLLAILISLSALTDKLRLPYPILLVVAGVLIGFVPGLPRLPLDPGLIFLVFLPPLLYDAASHTSWHDLKANIRPISALGVSLVFFTVTAVACTAHYIIPSFGWPLAFLLGAIVSPPDAMAATAIIKGLGLNKQVISILEGESLINDASALIAYRYALIAVTTGNFVLWQAGLQFFLIAGGGILAGVIMGYGMVVLHKRINNHPLVETSLTLLTPFLSYLLGEHLHTSGILAVVSTGLIIQRHSPEIFSYETRTATRFVWDNLIFLLNGFIFILIGLQLPVILEQLPNYRLSALIGYGLVVSLATIVVRILWVFTSAWSFRYFRQRKTKKGRLSADGEGDPTWKNVLIVAWTGTRGMISMTTALALPLTLFNGKPFPERQLIIFVCFVVIFITLVVQGYSLPLLTRLLRITPSHYEEKEERKLQLYLVRSTLNYLDEPFGQQLDADVRAALKQKYEQAAEKLTDEIKRYDKNERRKESSPVRVITDTQKALIEITQFQRNILLRLHKEGNISNEVIRQVEKQMDIDELKFQQSLPSEQDQQMQV